MGRKKQSLKITLEIVPQRKIELIKRDPLTHEWNNLIKEEKSLKKESPRKIELSNRLERIGRKLISKWQVSLMQNPYKSSPNPLAYLDISAGAYPTVFDATDYISNLKREVKRTLKIHHYPNVYIPISICDVINKERNIIELLKVGYPIFSPEGGYAYRELSNGKYRGIAYIPVEGEIPILINPCGINEKNMTEVLNQVKDILKKRIKERKSRITKIWKPLPQAGESPELGFIYSLREDVFNKYLKWYDLNVEEKISNRLIAYFDNINKTNPPRALEILETFRHKKIKWGIPVKGEDNVEKGVKLIYNAIHRKKYVQKNIKPLFEEYNCPQHKRHCSTSCGYYKSWKDKFNRLHPE